MWSTAEYETPLLAHATMEPCNATVHLQKDRLDIWMGSQSALDNAKMAAEEAGLKPEQVYFHQMYLGGGFGRRTFGDELRSRHPGGQGGQHPSAAAAAVVARTGYARRPLPSAIGDPAERRAYARRQAGRALHPKRLRLDPRSTGRPVKDGIDFTALEGIGPSVPYNKVPNWYTGQMLKNTHVPVAYWRSVGGSQNCFYLESFIDELAHAAGKDPLEFRRSSHRPGRFAGRAGQAGARSATGTSRMPPGAGAAFRWWTITARWAARSRRSRSRRTAW